MSLSVQNEIRYEALLPLETLVDDGQRAQSAPHEHHFPHHCTCLCGLEFVCVNWWVNDLNGSKCLTALKRQNGGRVTRPRDPLAVLDEACGGWRWLYWGLGVHVCPGELFLALSIEYHNLSAASTWTSSSDCEMRIASFTFNRYKRTLIRRKMSDNFTLCHYPVFWKWSCCSLHILLI